MTAETETPLHASTSSSIHLMFDTERLPSVRVQPGSPRMSLYLEVEQGGFPGHDARVILSAHREALLALLDQARTVVKHAPEPEPPSAAELAEAEQAGR